MKVPFIAPVTYAALALLCEPSAFGKRLAPEPVPPVVWEGIEFRALLHSGVDGIVEAYDVSSGRKIWETTVYHIEVEPPLETDVQWVYISMMEMEAKGLLVMNERRDCYWLDPWTGVIVDKDIGDAPKRDWTPWYVAGASVMLLALYLWWRIPGKKIR